MVRILIVEDQKIMQKYFEYIIMQEPEFRHVQTVSDAREAVKICDYSAIDLVIMDVQTFHNHDGLSAGKEIREKYQDWQENHGQPDVAALRGELAGRWNAMTPEQQQALRDNRQNRPSISNPGNSPRSPLDDRGGTLPRTENGLLAPGALPKADNALLTPSTQPKVDARPHLPRTMTTPVRPPTVRPAIIPGFAPMRSFPGIRRR